MIRRATKEDLPVLVAMAYRMHGESPEYRNEKFDPDNMRSFLEHAMGETKSYIAVAIVSDRIVAMMGGSIVPYMFNFLGGYGTDFGLYVLPEHRGGRSGLALIMDFEHWVASCGINKVKLGESSGISPEKYGDILSKMGYHQSGSIYTKGI